MKVGHLIEYNIRFFLESHTENVVGRLVPHHFVKNQTGGCLWIKSLKCYKVLFLLYVQFEVY